MAVANFGSQLSFTGPGGIDGKLTRLSVAERDAIPVLQRIKGMTVNVRGANGERSVDYWLPTDDLTNAGWKEKASDGGCETFVFVQETPSAVWNIQHNLGTKSFTVFTVNDSDDQIIGAADAKASTDNLTVIRFSEPLSGTAYLR